MRSKTALTIHMENDFVARSRTCVCGGFKREIVLERLCDIESSNERLKGRQELKQVQLVSVRMIFEK